MSGMGLVAVGVGAALGAWLRWAFAVLWNAINPALPYGTLAANLLGGYLIGVAVGFFDTHASLPPEWRLLAVTGFLGGLTTFSTFSSEVMANILAGLRHRHAARRGAPGRFAVPDPAGAVDGAHARLSANRLRGRDVELRLKARRSIHILVVPAAA